MCCEWLGRLYSALVFHGWIPEWLELCIEDIYYELCIEEIPDDTPLPYPGYIENDFDESDLYEHSMEFAGIRNHIVQPPGLLPLSSLPSHPSPGPISKETVSIIETRSEIFQISTF